FPGMKPGGHVQILRRRRPETAGPLCVSSFILPQKPSHSPADSSETPFRPGGPSTDEPRRRKPPRNPLMKRARLDKIIHGRGNSPGNKFPLAFSPEIRYNVSRQRLRHAPIAQGIERWSPEPGAQVRILVGAPHWSKAAADRLVAACLFVSLNLDLF